jgi:tricarballylate dehydrogenase
MCAALAARENRSRVLVLERAPFGLHGGNTAFTAGALRFAYNNQAEILELIPDLSPEMIRTTDFGSYPDQSFYEDLGRVTEYRTDPELADILVSRSFQTLKWLYGYGVRYLPIYGRQAFKVDGKFTFWGGLVLETVGGGPGLVDSLTKALHANDIDLWYGARACSLLTEGGRVCGVRVRRDGREESVRAGAVVLASGGFQDNT